jgi:proline dehydrogenase
MPGEYEMEMLLGVRNSGARDLVRAGEKVRLCMPFGHNWFPYTIQRIGDNPVNAWMLARSIISKA